MPAQVGISANFSFHYSALRALQSVLLETGFSLLLLILLLMFSCLLATMKKMSDGCCEWLRRVRRASSSLLSQHLFCRHPMWIIAWHNRWRATSSHVELYKWWLIDFSASRVNSVVKESMNNRMVSETNWNNMKCWLGEPHEESRHSDSF